MLRSNGHFGLVAQYKKSNVENVFWRSLARKTGTKALISIKLCTNFNLTGKSLPWSLQVYEIKRLMLQSAQAHKQGGSKHAFMLIKRKFKNFLNF